MVDEIKSSMRRRRRPLKSLIKKQRNHSKMLWSKILLTMSKMIRTLRLRRRQVMLEIKSQTKRKK